MQRHSSSAKPDDAPCTSFCLKSCSERTAPPSSARSQQTRHWTISHKHPGKKRRKKERKLDVCVVPCRGSGRARARFGGPG
eukprot:192270-Rhodomonas_salina.2